ncbi:MAG: hypothetical protein QF464_23740, partial [Myxococcota bacterium]|nr:hypothetical protein [Myxococcota bacterium]
MEWANPGRIEALPAPGFAVTAPPETTLPVCDERRPSGVERKAGEVRLGRQRLAGPAAVETSPHDRPLVADRPDFAAV